MSGLSHGGVVGEDGFIERERERERFESKKTWREDFEALADVKKKCLRLVVS